ncbi:TIGR00645 family protein [Parendozoicomonas haliclonae]|uniref:UPF0114 protein EHSB41UT_01179 n=1 Tax=Parendozoicomonas haliclonae TaxID=1960125 RepID=A0A1X7AH74_9GAMM|nr:TIGR00645 family protein [Parendozoicomonas haliclonae]SMA40344.1 hypothetical protein EHSB41UT_01179 [Parendozoicomonas haliclonae]
MKALEKSLESLIYSSRWLLAPLYLGLSLVLVAVLIKFYQTMFELLANITVISDKSLILATLGVVDLVLVSGLTLMVMLSSYENFVSKIDMASEDRELTWLGKMDADTLKTKLSVSIVAISSIHLLRVFMDVEKIPNDKILWYTVIHLVFVVSALGMSFATRIAGKQSGR